MAWFSADLHVHSCLSPCGDLSASPRVIAEMARDADIDLLALTDHNSSLNCPAFAHHAQRLGLGALFGMEATCAEEAHVLCLFGTLETALEFSSWAYGHLADVKNSPDGFGDQVYVNIDDEIEGSVEKLLIGAQDTGLSDLGAEVRSRGGLFIPAHIDRGSMSLMSMLGYVPPDHYDGLEILKPGTRPRDLGPEKARNPQGRGQVVSDAMFEALAERLQELRLMPGLAWQDCLNEDTPEGIRFPLPVFTASSDAHFPSDIGQRRTLFWAERPDFAGLREALGRGWALGAWTVKAPIPGSS